MKIYKHKSLDLTADEIFEMCQGDIPEDVNIDIIDNEIIASPNGECELFPENSGEYELLMYME